MAKTADEDQLSGLAMTRGAFGDKLPAAQAETGAAHLIGALPSGDLDERGGLLEALVDLVEQLPWQARRTIVSRLAQLMRASADQALFVQLAGTLWTFPIAAHPRALESATDLLQAPMAHGETRDHLLRYYSRVAGVANDKPFKTNDDLVRWTRQNLPDLDLARRPRNPFRSMATTRSL